MTDPTPPVPTDALIAADEVASTPRRTVTLSRWLAIAAPIAALVVGVGIGSAGGAGNAAQVTADAKQITTLEQQRDQAKSDLADEKARTAKSLSDLQAREDAVAEREAAVTKVEDVIAANTFPGSGTYLVNVDINPGVYRSNNNSSCYWERDGGLSGTLDDILANDNVTGQAVVEIFASDVAFTTSRCGDWTKIN